MRIIAFTLAGVIGLAGLAGCPEEFEPEPREPAEPGEPAEPAPPANDEPLGVERMEDEQLAQEVRDRIQQEAQLAPNDREITVSVDQGQVTLGGHVPSEQESQQIEQIAADVAGEENVQNELQVGEDPQELDAPEQPEPDAQPEPNEQP